jgi:hypothetical protein
MPQGDQPLDVDTIQLPPELPVGLLLDNPNLIDSQEFLLERAALLACLQN